MKDMQTVFDDLGWLYTEQAQGYADDAAKQLGRVDELIVEHYQTPKQLTAELLMSIASAQTSIAHSLAHLVGLVEVIAQAEAVRP